MHPWLFRLLALLLLGSLTGRPGELWAQCPAAANCLPGNAPASNLLFGMGIVRVRLANLDTITNGAADGYKDYSCRTGAVLLRGTTYQLTVATNANADEQLKAWIDWDNNGTFDPTAELVLSSRGRQHSGLLTVPANLLVGATYRLRLAADYINSPVPGPCTTPLYSQTEDYRVVIAAGAIPRPVAEFASNDTVTCAGSVAFRDASRNAPTAWQWSFGDGTTSTQQHPSHTYAQPGVYTVKLRACNQAGCDSLARVAYVRVLDDGPVPGICQPATIAYCCQFGLQHVQLATLTHAPGGGGAGYQDASCRHRANLTAGRPYTLQLTTGPASAQDIRVYLDLNGDGQLDATTEQLYAGLGMQNPAVPLVISATTPGLVYQRALRLRVCADYAGSPATGPCSSPQQGQVVDYSVVVVPDAAPPTAGFTLAYTRLCGPTQVTVSSTSSGATSYSWDFGDGTTATGPTPPPHAYSIANVYQVSLVVHNSNGLDSAKQQVVVAGRCPAYCPAGGLGNPVSNEIYFTRVQVAGLDNPGRRGSIGYADNTAQVVPIQQGQVYPLRTESPPWTFAGDGPWVRMTAWIDYNQDGVFTAAERIGPVGGFSPHQTTFRVPLSARPGATRLRVQLMESTQMNDPYNSCASPGQGAYTEDYTALILPARVAPQAGFTVDQPLACTGTVQFRDTSWAAPTQWRWEFGDGATSLQQHPQHTYTQAGTYAVTLNVTNPSGTSTVQRLGAVTVAQLGPGPRPAACLPPAGPGLAATMGAGDIDLISVGTWRYTNPAPHRFTPYRDETCGPVATLIAGDPVTFSMHALTTFSVRAKVWLDADDDGEFDPINELLYVTPDGYGVANPRLGTLTAPAGAALNRPLRLRVWWMSDYNTQIVWVDGDPCFRSQQWGQVRDFTAVVTLPTGTISAGLPATNWEVYPTNPVSELSIRAATSTSGTLQLHDVLGRIVYQQLVRVLPGQPLKLPIPSLAPGMYFVSLAENKLVRRIVIQ